MRTWRLRKRLPGAHGENPKYRVTNSSRRGRASTAISIGQFKSCSIAELCTLKAARCTIVFTVIQTAADEKKQPFGHYGCGLRVKKSEWLQLKLTRRNAPSFRHEQSAIAGPEPAQLKSFGNGQPGWA